MIEIGANITCEKAKSIPAMMMKVQHVEHAYECKSYISDSSQKPRLNVGKRHTLSFNIVLQAQAFCQNLSMIILTSLPSGKEMGTSWLTYE